MNASGKPDPARRAARGGHTRRGYTLAEMMLVLALLAIITAIVLPSFSEPLATEELRKAADEVRAAWTQARVEAMTTGLTQVFRFEPETGNYAVAPWVGGDAALEASTADAALGEQGADATGMLMLGESQGPRSEGEEDSNTPRLPEGIKFAIGETLIDSRSVEIAMAEGQTEAQPILFFADGTTSTALVVLANERKQKIALELRGLTGTVTVSDVDSSEQAELEE